VRTLRAFRAVGFEPLEDRVVPTVLSSPVLFEPSFAIPAQVQNLQSVRVAFDTFMTQYVQAFDRVLLAPAPDGSVNPAANRAAFDQRVDQDLIQLDNAIVSAISTSNLPNSQALIAQVQSAIVGDSAQSLQSRLAALPTPPTSPGTQATTVLAATQNLSQIIRTVESLFPSTPRATNVPSGMELITKPLSTTRTPETTQSSASVLLTHKVRQAYTSFLQSYFHAVQDVLLAPGADGTINPVANRAAFDARVNTSLNSLNGAISSAFGKTPQASPVVAKVQQVLVGPGANSLEAQLKALPSPASAQGQPLTLFGLDSTRAIGSSLALMMGDVAAFVRSLDPGK
jgi:hypothetical protein